jgi:hypothetical protein
MVGNVLSEVQMGDERGCARKKKVTDGGCCQNRDHPIMFHEYLTFPVPHEVEVNALTTESSATSV